MTHATLTAALRALDDVAHRCCPTLDAILSADVNALGPPTLILTPEAFSLAFDGEEVTQRGLRYSRVLAGVLVVAYEADPAATPRTVRVGG